MNVISYPDDAHKKHDGDDKLEGETQHGNCEVGNLIWNQHFTTKFVK